MNRMMIGLAMLCTVFSVRGETYYLTDLTDRPDVYAGVGDAYYWKDSGGNRSGTTPGTPMNPSDEYVIANGQTIRTKASNNAGDSQEFGGKLVRIGDIGKEEEGYVLHYSGLKCVTTYSNDGVSFDRGQYVFQNANGAEFTIVGDIHVAAPSSRAFPVYAGYARQTVNWDGKMSGDAGTAINIGHATVATKAVDNTHFRFNLLGGASEFYGTLNVLAPVPSDELPNYWTELMVAGNCGGTVNVGQHTKLIASESGMTLAGLTLSANSRLVFNATGTQRSSFVATESAAVSGPVGLELSLEDYMVDNGETNKFPLLTVPVGTGLSENDFSLIAGAFGLADLFSLKVGKDADHEYLYLVQEPVVTLKVSDADGKDTGSGLSSAFQTATSWSDGELPHPGAHYYIRDILASSSQFTTVRTPTGDAYEFPGMSLVVDSRCVIMQGVKRFSGNVLRLLDGGMLHTMQYIGANTAQVDFGRMEIPSGNVYLTSYATATLEIASPVFGAATIMHGYVYGRTSSPHGRYAYTGSLSDFTGSVNVTSQYILEPAIPTVASAEKYNILYLRAGNFEQANGLAIERYSRIVPRESEPISLPATCGLGIGANGAIDCDNVAYGPLVVKGAISLDGELEKMGAGTLVLSGGVPTVGSKGVFVLSAGCVRIGAADSINGLCCRIADEAVLEVGLNPADQLMANVGLRNSATDIPFILTGSLGKLPIKWDFSVYDELMKEKRSFETGLITMSSSAYDNLKGILPSVVRPRGYKVTYHVDTESYPGCVVLKMNAEPSGLMLLLR